MAEEKKPHQFSELSTKYLMNKNPIQIVGAGFSGLSLAYFFVKEGYPVVIYEKENQVGGVIDSYFSKEMLIETAANGFLCSKKIEALFKDIGCELLLANKESKKKFIYRQGLKTWPLTLSETVKALLKALKSLVSWQFKPLPNENLKDWCFRCLTPEVNQYLIQPMVYGIFAANTSKLSARLVLGSLFFKKEKGTYRGLVSAKGGMKEVMTKLKDYLLKANVQFKPQFSTEQISLPKLEHNTFLATSLNSSFFNLTTKSKLQKISLLRITLSFKKSTELDGFGVLFPENENFFSLGVLANTKIFNFRGKYNESWILGGSEHPDHVHFSDQQILDMIIQDRKRLFGPLNADFEIDNYVIIRWQEVLPLYDLELSNVLEANSQSLKNLTGNYLGVIGLSGIHERNHTLVKGYLKNEKKTSHPQ